MRFSRRGKMGWEGGWLVALRAARQGLLTTLVLGASALLLAAEPNSREADKAAIRRRAKAYFQAVEQGDAAQIASFWTSEGDYIDDNGEAVKGRDLARQKAERSEAKGDTERLIARPDVLRFVTPDVAIEDGSVCHDRPPIGNSVVRRYTAIWVRRGGNWLLDGVRERPAPAQAEDGSHLKDLAWMVGKWTSDDGGASLRCACQWSEAEHFLLREIEVNLPGEKPLRVSQRIGWDSREKQVKSWAFDSLGGHGEALWFRRGDRWVVEGERIMADGSRSTSTTVFSHEGADRFTWHVINVEIDGAPAPDRSLRMVREKRSKP